VIKIAIRVLTAVSVTIFLLGTPACTSITRDSVSPGARLVSVQLVKMGLTKQRFRVAVLLNNPNDHPLDIRRAEAKLEINDVEFVSGVTQAEVQLPANGEALVEIDASSKVANVLSQLGTIMKAQSVRYRISGTLRLDDIIVPIPFARSEEVALKDILR